MRGSSNKDQNFVELSRLEDDNGFETNGKSAIGSSGSMPLLHDSQFPTILKKTSSRVSSGPSTGTLESVSKTPHGWHFWSIVCAVLSGTVLLANLILTTWATSTFPIANGVGTFQHGKCSRTRTLSLWSHMVINILSTLLLGASSYCLQCLGSPTRKEIDKAHQRSIAMDVGTPSLANLRRISRPRAISWCILAISSIPLHLLYNSAIFSEISTVEYNVFTVAQNFPTGGFFDSSSHNLTSFHLEDQLKNLQDSSHILQNLTNEDCMKTYFKDFVSSHGDVLTVSSTINETDSLLAIPIIAAPNVNNDEHQQPPFAFICDDLTIFSDGSTLSEGDHPCTLSASLPSAQNWKVQNHTIDYCLSQPVQEHCKLQFSLAIMIIVILCNLTKTLCMIFLALRSREEPLVTIGDAIASFMRQPDPTTAGLCLADIETFKNRDWEPKPIPYHPTPHRWYQSTTPLRWGLSLTLLVLPLLTASIFLKYALHWTHRGSITSQSLSLPSLWALGFGSVVQSSLLNWNLPGSGALVRMALVSNLPQLLLSLVYLAYNGLYTHMLLAQEYASYFLSHRALRTSIPRGHQRSTYRLQLPLAYSIPLLLTSALLHWLVSQSIFLVRIATYNSTTQAPLPRYSKYSVGYSCIAIICAIGVGIVMVLVVLGSAGRKLEGGMPVVGGSSAGIGAACQGGKKREEEGKVGWGEVVVDGEVGVGADGDGEGTGVGHCRFTTGRVERPVRGRLYAGVSYPVISQ